jgi:acetyl-CoA acetyltransferase
MTDSVITSDVFVYDAVRTPFGRHAGALARVRPDDLAALVIRTLADQVVAVPGADLARDESIRADTTPEKLAGLKPVFRPAHAGGTVTAGNASPLNDGASAVLLGSTAAEKILGLSPLARVAGRGAAATEPQFFGLACVSRVYTDLAVFLIEPDGVVVRDVFGIASTGSRPWSTHPSSTAPAADREAD